MKIEHGIRGKSRYAFGFALAAGVVLTTTLIAHAERPDLTPPCTLGSACPVQCEPSETCGPVETDTVTGVFVKQKPNLVCVYQCSGEQMCTEQNADCSISTFSSPVSFRSRMSFAAGACPMDAASAAWICVNGEPE
jgi:hypothetical protein